ncbi:MAG: TIGR04282 family arsenosugar biosynthesis glycosyltransferase [Candidatus Altiarchaeota archaeon]
MRDVIVFTKVPEKGQVKTRLQRKFPPHVVEELYTAFLLDTLDQLREYFPYVAYWPPNKLQLLWNILGDRKYVQQNGRDLGEKIMNVFRDFRKMGIRDVIVVGCDVPLMKKEHVQDAFQKMTDCDLVIGPSHDGGFYLIGGHEMTEEIFDKVDWDGKDVSKRIIENARDSGRKVTTLEELRDIDTPEDIDAVWKTGGLDEKSRTYRILKRIK